MSFLPNVNKNILERNEREHKIQGLEKEIAFLKSLSHNENIPQHDFKPEPEPEYYPLHHVCYSVILLIIAAYFLFGIYIPPMVITGLIVLFLFLGLPWLNHIIRKSAGINLALILSSLQTFLFCSFIFLLCAGAIFLILYSVLFHH